MVELRIAAGAILLFAVRRKRRDCLFGDVCPPTLSSAVFCMDSAKLPIV